MKIPTCLAVLALAGSVGCSADAGRDIVSPSAQLSVSDPSSGPSAHGHADWINPAGESVTRLFHAKQRTDGTVDGKFVQYTTSLTGETRVNRGDIDCLLIGPIAELGLGANEAVMSGPIREIMNPDMIGQTQIFRVQDNGEGSQDPPDEMGPLSFRTPESELDCRSFLPLDRLVTPIIGGNIQVKP
jgi:hypothetical protein